MREVGRFTVVSDLGAVRWWATAAGIEGADKLGRVPLADARRDGERRRRERGQAGAITSKQADLISRRAARDGIAPKGLRDFRAYRRCVESVLEVVRSRRAPEPGRNGR